MGALGVHLIAAIKVTSVDSPLFGIWRLGPPRATYAVDTEGRHGAASTRGDKRQRENHCERSHCIIEFEFEIKQFQRTNHVSQ